jgi:hypothetical protein
MPKKYKLSNEDMDFVEKINKSELKLLHDSAITISSDLID